jgi:hypothetical protein
MSQAVDGALASAAYSIGAIFATESDTFDRRIASVMLPAAQAMLGLGSRVSTTRDRDRIAEDLAALAPRLGGEWLSAASW